MNHTFAPLLLAIIVMVSACQGPPPFVFLGDQRPVNQPSEDHPCVNYDESLNTADNLLKALSSRSDASAFYNWLRDIETRDPYLYAKISGTGDGTVTLLLPNDQAIARFESNYPEVLLDKDRFLTLIKHHFLLVKVSFNQFQQDGFQPAMNREPLEYTVTDQYCVTFEDQARLILADDICSNGVIHLIDEVLIPQKGF